MVTDAGYTQTQVARDLGERPDEVSRWVRDVDQKGAAHAFPGNGQPTVGDETIFRLMRDKRHFQERCERLEATLATYLDRRR